MAKQTLYSNPDPSLKLNMNPNQGHVRSETTQSQVPQKIINAPKSAEKTLIQAKLLQKVERREKLEDSERVELAKSVNAIRKHTDGYEVNYYPEYTKTDFFDDEKKFVQDWFGTKEAKDRFHKYGKSLYNKMPRSLLDFNISDEKVNDKFNVIKENLNTVKTYDRSLFPSDTYFTGNASYKPFGHYVSIGTSYPDRGNAVHEYSHASRINSLWSPYIYEQIKKDVNFKNNASYVNDTDEIYSRIMNSRFDNKLKPGQIVTPELYDKMRKTQYLEDSFDKETIIKLMNTLSYNNKNNNINIG